MTEIKTTIKGKIEIPVDIEIELVPGESNKNSIEVTTKLKSMTLGDPELKIDEPTTCKAEPKEPSLETYTFVPDFENTRIIVGSTVYLTEEDLKKMSYTSGE